MPPNPRLLITAFPAVIVLAAGCGDGPGTLLLGANGVLLVGLSYLTFVGSTSVPERRGAAG